MSTLIRSVGLRRGGSFAPLPPIDDYVARPYADDYELIAHPTLGSPSTALATDQAWEATAPHNLSVVDMGAGHPSGFRYWGYYGLQGQGGVGLARSNDLTTWAKDENNPILSNVGGRLRWPSVVKIGSTLHMAVTEDYLLATQRIDHYTSGDGVNWTLQGTLVSPDAGFVPGNPFLFIDPADDALVLFYFWRGSGTTWQIRGRRAGTVAGLAAATPALVLESPHTLAAPAMTFFDGYYWLYVEDTSPPTQAGGHWRTLVYKAPTVEGPFQAVTNGGLLGDATDQEACPMPVVVGNTLYLFTCHLNGATWDVRVRSATAEANTSPTVPATNDAPWRNLSASVPVQMALVDGESAIQMLNNGAGAVQQHQSLLTIAAIQDFKATFRVKRRDTYVHLSFRRNQAGAGYRCWVGDSDYELGHVLDWTHNTPTVVSSGGHGATWDSGWNTLVLTCNGTSLKLELNGVTVFDVTNATYQQAGFFALETYDNQGFYVDSIDVEPL